MIRVLYVSQTGMTEPLARSQVLPYVTRLAKRGYDFELVSMEPEAATDAAITSTAAELERAAIRWSFTRRSAGHDLATKTREAVSAFAELVRSAMRAKPRIIHTRSYVPTMIAMPLVAALPATKLLFDCRGLLWDEYADCDHWRRDSFRYRAMKAIEPSLYRHADGVVTLTEALSSWLREQRWLSAKTPFAVVPCCVDLERFTASAMHRAEWRARLGLGERFTLAYAGSLGSWYCEEEMAKLFAEVAKLRTAVFVVFTRSDTTRLRRALAREGVSEVDVVIRAVSPDEMPAALSAADAALSLIMPAFSKMASSPVKIGEYLAVGLPVVVNRGVGDCDLLLANVSVAIDAGQMGPEELTHAARRVVDAARDPRSSEAARAAAKLHYDVVEGVSRYATVYEQLVGG